jgi:uncharacterized protein YodC (DUF2158 family)
MAEISFKPGDIVRLKSGGPPMTIAHIDGTEAYCEWFNDKREVQGRDFQVTSLQPHSLAGESRRVGASFETLDA